MPFLLSLPLELLAEFVAHIAALADIYSLSSTCRALYRLLIAHRSYHTLTLAGGVHKYPFLWMHLAGRPHLARNVRVLKLPVYGQQMAETLQESRKHEGTEEEAEIMLEALRSLRGLREVVIHSTCFDPYPAPMKQKLWDAVWTSPMLERVEYLRYQPAGMAIGNPSEEDGEDINGMLSLSHLKAVKIDGIPLPRLWTKFHMLLHHCPALQELFLPSTIDEELAYTLSQCHFPHLTRLASDQRWWGFRTVELFARFLEAHPGLVHLVWLHDSATPLRDGALSGLKTLHAGPRFVQSLLDDRCRHKCRPLCLEELGRIDVCLPTLDQLDGVDGATLQQLHIGVLGPGILPHVARKLPNVRHLQLPMWTQIGGSARFEKWNLVHVQDVMALWPELETLDGAHMLPLNDDEDWGRPVDPAVYPQMVVKALRGRYSKLRWVDGIDLWSDVA